MLTHMFARASRVGSARFTAVLTAVVLCATLAACGGKDSDADKPDSQPVAGGTARAKR